MSIIPQGMTIREYFERDAQRKKRRKVAAAFNAKMKGIDVLTSRKLIIARLDHLFSLFIRRRDRAILKGCCVFGCGRPIECCFHFVTRSKHIVRWDPLNAVGSCHADNYTMEFNPHPFIAWYMKTNGKEAYDALIERSNKIAKFSKSDLLEIEARIKSWVEGSSEIHKKGEYGR